MCIEGPQFSTRAESLLYRSWGVSVIGMTSMPEAKLAREAELPFATLALATDYDCWHDAHEDVTVEAVVAVDEEERRHARKQAIAAPRHARCPTRPRASRTARCAGRGHDRIVARVSRAARERLGWLLPLTDRESTALERRRLGEVQPPMHQSSVLIVGSLAFDDLEMPTGTFENVVGGAATYASIAASLLAPGAPRRRRRRGLRRGHLDMRSRAARRRHRGRRARRAARRSAGAGATRRTSSSRETLDTQLNVFADFRPKIPAAYRESTPYVLLGNIHPTLQLEVLAQVEQARSSSSPTR